MKKPATQTSFETGQLQLSWESARHIYHVSEINSALQNLLESNFRSVSIVGEISGCRLASSGHFYFCLKDLQSQLKCVLFKGTIRAVRFKPQDGISVIARGSLEIYQPRGEYQLIIDSVEPQGGGALQLAFEQLKKQLADEGLFHPSRKKPLPTFPRRIAIVTSPTGAVIHDMLQVLGRRFPGLYIRLFPALVQGEGSIEQICRGIDYFTREGWADVLIVARGGGSLEDLWTFNEEAVARAIAACPLPIISAIGHETDFTIADFVADFRAPTPSAAAEVVICTKENLLERIAACRSRAFQSVRYRLTAIASNLHQKGTGRAAILVNRALAKRTQLLDEFEYRLRDIERRKLAIYRQTLTEHSHRLQATDLRLRFSRRRQRQEYLIAALLRIAHSQFSGHQRRIATANAHLKQLSPLNVLSRGYAIVEDSQKIVLRSANKASEGDRLRIRLQQGTLAAVVSAAHPDGES